MKVKIAIEEQFDEQPLEFMQKALISFQTSNQHLQFFCEIEKRGTKCLKAQQFSDETFSSNSYSNTSSVYASLIHNLNSIYYEEKDKK